MAVRMPPVYDSSTGQWRDPITGAVTSAPTGVAGSPGMYMPQPAQPTAEEPLQQYLDQFQTPEAAPATDPWEQIATSYGLGAPPAVGMPATMPNINIGPAPQAQASLIDTAQMQPTPVQQMPVSDNIKALAGGEGYTPDILARMRANAVQDASNAGLQEMGQTKRMLGQAGVRGGAAAAVQGDVARRTGQAQGNALGQIDINNAQVGNQNRQFGVGQETSIGQNNQQAANAMALADASRLFSGLQSNQAANNTTNQMNTGMTFQRQNDQASMDFNNQKSQWDELNKRYGSAQNILGSWGAAA